MKVAAYLRVSTTEQVEEGYSIQAQRTRLEAYATSQGWEIVSFYVDEGISAKNMDRPELERMLKGVKQRAFDCVLVYRLDRLTRSVMDLHSLINTFEKYHVRFKSATEVYDTTTAMGRLFITLVGALAQWERENLGERVSFGMEQKAREGKWAVSIPPLGYDKDGDNLIINESEATVVREIFNLCVFQNKGTNSIARILNERGIKTKSGVEFPSYSVRYILRNPIYIGTLRYNYRRNKENYFEVENAVPPIIEKDLFNQANLILSRRGKQHPRRATSPFIFTGIATCSRCGAKLTGSYSNAKSKNGQYYDVYSYRCPKSLVGSCDLPNISQNFLEKQFIKFIEEWEVKDTALPKKKDNIPQINAIQKELNEIEKRRSKWQYAWVNEMISDTDFNARIKEENEKEKMLLTELEALNENPVDLNINIMEILKDVKHNWEHLTQPEKKQLLQIAVKELKVDKDITLGRRQSAVLIPHVEFY